MLKQLKNYSLNFILSIREKKDDVLSQFSLKNWYNFVILTVKL